MHASPTSTCFMTINVIIVLASPNQLESSTSSPHSRIFSQERLLERERERSQVAGRQGRVSGTYNPEMNTTVERYLGRALGLSQHLTVRTSFQAGYGFTSSGWAKETFERTGRSNRPIERVRCLKLGRHGSLSDHGPRNRARKSSHLKGGERPEFSLVSVRSFVQ